MEELKRYLIKSTTMGLIPKHDPYGKLGTTVVEEEKTFTVWQSPFKIVKESCLYYDSEYEGKVKASKQILKGSKIVPVIISNSLRICFLPTKAAGKEDCLWLSSDHILEIEKHVQKQSKVLLQHNQEIIVGLSKETMDTKVSRAARLVTTFAKRNRHPSPLSVWELKNQLLF